MTSSFGRRVLRFCLEAIISLFVTHLLGCRLCCVALFFCASCGKSDDSKITVYRIPKETQPNAMPQPAAMDSAAPAAVHWTAPSGWEEQPALGISQRQFSCPRHGWEDGGRVGDLLSGSGRRVARECESLARSTEARADLGCKRRPARQCRSVGATCFLWIW